MERKNVTSSRVNSIGWSNNTLEVEFNTGKVYQYTPVTEEKYNELLASPAIGKDIQAIVSDKTLTCTPQ
jgi:hypothetical protein